MIVIRPITRSDQDIFAEFSFESTLGITHLPRNRDKLHETIKHSEASFQQQENFTGKEEYYFVLEDLTSKRMGGTCAIFAQSSYSLAYFYRIQEIETTAKHFSAPKTLKILKVVPNPPHSSEVGALYLQPTFRHSGQGRLLSLSRFLFIAAHRQRFKNKVMANLRGYIDARQTALFWEFIGRHFCELSFVELMGQLDLDRTFISEILPQFPLYFSLLPQEAQEIIGKVHDSSKPALDMLLHENFSISQDIDIFDGGPILTASTSAIRTIKNSELLTIGVTKDFLAEEAEFILANEKLDFRACFGKIQFISKTKGLIHEEVADALLVKPGEQIRYISVH